MVYAHQHRVISTEIVCNKCHIAKPVGMFFRDSRSPTGYRSACKSCSTISAEDADKLCPPHLLCTSCQGSKPREQFGRSGVNLKTGRSTYCKDCVVSHRQEKRRREPEWARARDAKIPTDRKPKPDSMKSEAQQERRKAYRRQWQHDDYAKDPEKYLSRQARWAADNHDKMRDNVHRRKARERAAVIVGFDPTLLTVKWDYWGGNCWMCGGDACEWDHVKPLAKGGVHCLANLRPACRSCNASKNAKWPLAA